MFILNFTTLMFCRFQDKHRKSQPLIIVLSLLEEPGQGSTRSRQTVVNGLESVKLFAVSCEGCVDLWAFSAWLKKYGEIGSCRATGRESLFLKAQTHIEC